MADRFTYDVFLSRNSKDKPQVRRMAKRLKQAGRALGVALRPAMASRVAEV